MRLVCPECGSIHITKVDDGQEESDHTCEDCGYTSPLHHFSSDKDEIDDEFDEDEIDDDDIADEVDFARPDDLWPEERDELEDD